MVRKVDHIGVAVSNLEEALKIYTDVLGLTDTISLSNSDANKLRIDTISSESTRRLRGGTGRPEHDG